MRGEKRSGVACADRRMSTGSTESCFRRLAQPGLGWRSAAPRSPGRSTSSRRTRQGRRGAELAGSRPDRPGCARPRGRRRCRDAEIAAVAPRAGSIRSSASGPPPKMTTRRDSRPARAQWRTQAPATATRSAQERVRSSDEMPQCEPARESSRADRRGRSSPMLSERQAATPSEHGRGDLRHAARRSTPSE